MPNTFAGYPLIDPTEIPSARRRFVRDDIPELELANSYYSLAGSYPDVGWLLLDRNSYNQVSKYSTSLSLVIQDFVNPSLTISNISIVQARCVTRGIVNDTNAIYLIQVTNPQGVMYNPWFQLSTNSQYNVRVPAYPDQFHTWSLNSGSTWTWNTMIQNLWNQASTYLGTYPNLPITPNHIPENMIFVGKPIWKVIGDLLAYLGLSVVGEYPNFSIAVMGANDTAFTTLQSNYSIYLEDDMEYIDGGSGRVPSQVVVYFHRRNKFYGTEETMRYDSLQWQSTPAYTVTVNAPSIFSGAAGVGHLWHDFTVRYDHDNLPIAEDVVKATALAQERVTQYFNDIFRGTQGMMKQCYSGVLPFSTGSLVDGVRWFNLGNDRSRYAGWHTEIIRGYVWNEATFNVNLEGFTLNNQ